MIHLFFNQPFDPISVVNKIPNWSRLGRLRRSAAPTFKGRLAERQAMTGRLVCDLKVSAKELIRCKSYELASLAERLLGKSAEGRAVIGVEEMRKAYESSRALLNAVSVSLEEARDALQCVCELNALPLALQITQVRDVGREEMGDGRQVAGILARCELSQPRLASV